MKTNQIQIEKLLIIAKHLFSSKLNVEPFTIVAKPEYVEHEDGSFEYREPFFQYVIEELQYIFPIDWFENEDGEMLWIGDKEKNMKSSLQSFLGISEDAILHLLMPGRQNLERFGGKILQKDSTHLDIAVNIVELANTAISRSMASTDTIFLN